MAKPVRSHQLDKRLEAMGYRLVRHIPEMYATWAVIPTRRRVYLGIPNLDSVQAVTKQMEESLWLEFGIWFKEKVDFPCSPAEETMIAGQFLEEEKGLSREGSMSLAKRWYVPTE